MANRVAAGSAAALPPGTTARDGDEPDAGHDPITETGMSLADASQITVSLSDGVKTLGEISVKGLRKLLPLAGERGNAALVEAISVVLADRDQLAEAAS